MRVAIAFFFILVVYSTSIAQEKIVKPKPEKKQIEQSDEKNKQDKQQSPMVRSKLKRPPLTRTWGANVSSFANKYMGFGAMFQKNPNPGFGWSLQLQFYTVPSDEFYFDYYYYQLVQRDRGSMLMLSASGIYHLPILQREPNITPYLVIGGGPVLGIQSNRDYTFPKSTTHAYSVGGYTAFSGTGVSYAIGSWLLAFDIRYQLLRFPKTIFGKKVFDGVVFTVGFGKML